MSTLQLPLSFLRVKPSVDEEYEWGKVEQLLISLGSVGPISFEVIGLEGKAFIQLAVPKEAARYVADQISAYYPEAEVVEDKDIISRAAVSLNFGREHCLGRSHFFTLQTSMATEPYGALMGALAGLGKGDSALFQVLFVSTRRDWRQRILKASRNPVDPTKSAFVDIPNLYKQAEEKVSKPLFAVAVRLAASNESIIERLEGFFLSQFASEKNRLVPLQSSYSVESIRQRITYRDGMILNSQELAALAHIPCPRLIPANVLETAKHTSPPPELAKTNILVPLGVNQHRGKLTPVSIPEEWLTRYVSIFWGTGYGKTDLLKLFLKVVEKGYSLAFLDPKGDASKEFLDLIPENRVEDVIYFDPTEREYPPALNVLVLSDCEQEMLSSELMVALKRLFPRGSRVRAENGVDIASSYSNPPCL